MKKLLLTLLLSTTILSYSITPKIKYASICAASSVVGIGVFIAHRHYHNTQLLKKYKHSQKYEHYNNINSTMADLISGGKLGIYRKKIIRTTPDCVHNSKFNLKELDVQNESDIQKLHDLNILLAKSHEVSICPPTQDSTVLIAQSPDGTICGGIHYSSDANHIYIDTLAVHPHYRRQGIAKQLIQAIEHRHSDKKELQLCVSLFNEAAMLTYDTLGFE